MLFLLFLPLLTAAETVCGTGYPTRFLSYGQTSSLTATYGTPLGPFLAPYGPVMDGCHPISGETGVQAPLSAMAFRYSKEEPGLVERAVSNDTLNLGSYTLSYEPVPDHLRSSSVFAIRPTFLRLYGSASNSGRHNGIIGVRPQSDAAFSYDERGRLSHVRWLYANHTDEAAPRRVGVPSEQIASAPLSSSLSPVVAGGVNGVGEETYSYGDPEHPLHPTVYESHGCLGEVPPVCLPSDPPRSPLSSSMYACVCVCGCNTGCDGTIL